MGPAGVTRAQLAQIHIAKKELAMDDDSYRLLLTARFKVASAKYLSAAMASNLLATFRRMGWAPRRRRDDGRQDVTPAPGPLPLKRRESIDRFIHLPPDESGAYKQRRKVMALWRELGYAPGLIHERVQRMFGHIGLMRLEQVVAHEHLRMLICDLEQRVKSRKTEKHKNRQADYPYIQPFQGARR